MTKKVVTDNPGQTGYMDGYKGTRREPSEDRQKKAYEDGFRRGARDASK